MNKLQKNSFSSSNLDMLANSYSYPQGPKKYQEPWNFSPSRILHHFYRLMLLASSHTRQIHLSSTNHSETLAQNLGDNRIQTLQNYKGYSCHLLHSVHTTELLVDEIETFVNQTGMRMRLPWPLIERTPEVSLIGLSLLAIHTTIPIAGIARTEESQSEVSSPGD
ncbi:hypothetical protein SADUNF_Sadunf04G0015500 [Salix dunnii]|uniref:Uncharacterized protein n=1 Tax=Salix dunnii TaxID=1413687 RepID=A0A835KCQ5_9ROSI|nr:hypothetical protein SADUNF_Sadunf04G0015500 [Salix dunnii]